MRLTCAVCSPINVFLVENVYTVSKYVLLSFGIVGNFPVKLFLELDSVGQLKHQLDYRFTKLSAFLRTIDCRRDSSTAKRVCSVSLYYFTILFFKFKVIYHLFSHDFPNNRTFLLSSAKPYMVLQPRRYKKIPTEVQKFSSVAL